MDTFRFKVAVVILVLCGFALVVAPVMAGGGHGGDHSFEKSGSYKISLSTHPEASKIVPDKNLVETIVSVTHNGKPAENVTLSYRLDAPPKRFWFGTDFPVVEGTPLLQGTVEVTDGSQMFELVYPIRGNYTLRAKVRGPEGTTKKSFTIPVSENPQEKLNLGIFLFVLFLIGGLGGYFLTGSSSIRRAAVVFGLLGLGVMLFTPASAMAHGKGAYNPDGLQQRIGTSGQTGQYELHLRTFPQPVKVGEMLNVDLEVENKEADHGHHGHAESGEYRAEINFIHSAGGKKFVGQPVSLDENQVNVQVQLFDGAPHYMLTKVYRATEYHGEPGHEEKHAEGKSGHGQHAEESKHGDHQAEEAGHAGHDGGESGREEHAHEDAGGEHADEEESGGHGHGHGPSEPWEWQGQLDLTPGTYTIDFGQSGDPAMKWVLLPVGADHREEQAAKSMQGPCESVSPGTVIAADQTCYDFVLNETGTTHKLRVENGGTFRLFTQHLPSEFNMTVESAGGKPVPVDREFYPGKGELILTDVRRVDVQPVQPPVDDIVKIMLTLIGVTGLGFVAAWRFKVAMA